MRASMHKCDSSSLSPDCPMRSVKDAMEAGVLSTPLVGTLHSTGPFKLAVVRFSTVQLCKARTGIAIRRPLDCAAIR